MPIRHIVARLGFRSSRRGRISSPSRSAGDAARAAKDWLSAAEHYQRHLQAAPNDVAIWVQLGHALKENGRLGPAIEAYDHAVRIDSDDGDLMLSLGHAHKMAGNLTLAIEALRKSVAIDCNASALHELKLIGVPANIRRPGVSAAQHAAVLQLFGIGCEGLLPRQSSDMVVGPESTLRFLSRDPWIEFDVDPAGLAGAHVALLEIEASSSSEKPFVRGQVYVDLGEGYIERNSSGHALVTGQTSLILIEPARIKGLRWDPDPVTGGIAAPRLRLRPASSKEELMQLAMRHASDQVAIERLLEPLGDAFDGIRPRHAGAKPLPAVIAFGLDVAHDYDFWMVLHETLSTADYDRIDALTEALETKPRFSFIMPTYNTPPDLLRECIDAMLAQTYADFEICIADDHSSSPEIGAILSEYAGRDARIKVVMRPHGGHISAASNSAIELATGDYIVLVDHDDILPDFALFVIAWYINANPGADILFSDEDKMSPEGRRQQPYFKTQFNRYLMYGHNMVSHIGVYRRALVNRVGNFRLGLEGSQDYDLFLRCYELSADDRVIHIPHVLYHWRMIPGSTAVSADQKSYAGDAAVCAINGHFERGGIPLRVKSGPVPGCTTVYPTKTLATPVSIIIPTRNGLELLAPCIDSILSRPSDNIEILIVDNGSDDPALLDYLGQLSEDGLARILRHDAPFNFSEINNIAAAAANGNILCFLNNDVEVVSHDWLNRARIFLSLSDIGAVGARLLYPDGKLQHLGIALGMGAHHVGGTPHGGLDGDDPGYFGKAMLLQETAAVTAACMFVRKEDFVAVGGFEERLAVAYNDIDLCLRLRERGLRILADPQIVLVHKESQTRGSDLSGDGLMRLDREAQWIRERWDGLVRHDPFVSPNFDLARTDFAFAPRSRVDWPWRQAAGSVTDGPGGQTT